MKKQLENLLRSKNAFLKINNYCKLHHYTKTALGEEVDILKAEFSIHHFCDYTIEIKSRNCNKIIAELSNAMETAFNNAKNNFIKELKNGYIS